ncbi:acylphosphatase [bacterium]|nr:acylphosphatase [bacterium]
MVSAHILVSGSVQGVGFRWFVQREAEMFRLTGVVRNLPDGRVEIYTEGLRETIKTLIVTLESGNGISRVDSCDVTWANATGKYDGFRIVF